jgi:predicted RNA-binding Zn-ribbon protein involved in translation (DUF1610 family)
MKDKIYLKKIECKDNNDDTNDSFEIECPSCGYSPICLSCTDRKDGDTYKCPNCDLLHAISIVKTI